MKAAAPLQLTLRDQLAAAALAGILAAVREGAVDPRQVAALAYEFADAMLEVRK